SDLVFHAREPKESLVGHPLQESAGLDHRGDSFLDRPSDRSLKPVADRHSSGQTDLMPAVRTDDASLNVEAFDVVLLAAVAARPLDLLKRQGVLGQSREDRAGVPSEGGCREVKSAEPTDHRKVAAPLLVRNRLDAMLLENLSQYFLLRRKVDVDHLLAAGTSE